MKFQYRLPLIVILFLALVTRLYGIGWDQWFHLHPDERMLIMVTERVSFFSNLNPDFFNYGSLPIYLLRIIQPSGDYSSMLVWGRALSVFFDMLTIIFIFKITKKLFVKESIALAACFFYAVSFFPIQNSHFFVVDVFLTFFTTLILYFIVCYLTKPTLSRVVLIGINFAAMLATKFTSIVFLPLIVALIGYKSLGSFRKLIINAAVFIFSFLIFFYLFMPYAFIEFEQFVNEISAQIKMNSNPYVFPYTLQYVGTTAYLYYLKNIFFWGLGPIISLLSIFGLINIVKSQLSEKVNPGKILLLIFYIFYFIVIGRSSVKFMRYMLPLYPFFAVLAGYGFYLLSRMKLKFVSWTIVVGAIVWSFMFISIYSQPHTRIAATDWILKNIPAGSTLAVEHWDDRLPLYGSENYTFEELPLYEQPDDEDKWISINDKLNKTDYIIIASNRLYTPLQKLVDCEKYKVCYLKTAEYYDMLFNNKLSFSKIAEFKAFPELKLGPFNLMIDDSDADESFTVYDHPKIMIFKRSHKLFN